MKTPKAPQLQSKSLQDSTQEYSDPETPKSFSHEKNSLSDFAKELIRDCAEDRLNVYETYTIVLKGCAKSGYTIEQVGKYLRRVNRAIVRRENIDPPLAPPHHKPPLRTYLPLPPHLTNKKRRLSLRVKRV